MLEIKVKIFVHVEKNIYTFIFNVLKIFLIVIFFKL